MPSIIENTPLAYLQRLLDIAQAQLGEATISGINTEHIEENSALDYCNQIAQKLIDAGQGAAVIAELPPCIDQAWASPEINNLLVVALQKDGQAQQADSLIKAIIQRWPDSITAYQTYTWLLEEQQRYPEIVPLIQHLLDQKINIPFFWIKATLALSKLRKPKQALEIIEQAITLPEHGSAIDKAYAEALLANNQWLRAAIVAEKSLYTTPDDLDWMSIFANAIQQVGLNTEAEQIHNYILEKSIDNKLVRPTKALLCALYWQKKQLSQSIDICNEFIADHPDDHEFYYNRGFMKLTLGNYADGYADYEHRQWLGFTVFGENIPPWDGEKLADNTSLVLTAEQGIGDIIQCMRYLPWARQQAKQVFFLLPPQQQAFFGLLEHIDGAIESSAIPDLSTANQNKQLRRYPLMSLPRLAGFPPAHCQPYLKINPTLVEETRGWIHSTQEASRFFHVGIVWAGNPDHQNDHRRSTRLKEWAALGNIPGVLFHTLQKGGPEEEAALPPLGMHVHRLDQQIEHLGHTAAIIENLDLVITVDTSVAHLAGALGKPIWVLIPYNPDFRWGMSGETTDLYPSMRLFRQPEPNDWAPVMSCLAQELQKQVYRSTQENPTRFGSTLPKILAPSATEQDWANWIQETHHDEAIYAALVNRPELLQHPGIQEKIALLNNQQPSIWLSDLLGQEILPETHGTPLPPQIVFNKTKYLKASGNIAVACQLWAHCIDSYPKLAEARYQYGLSLRGADQAAAAEEQYNQAITLCARHAEARINLAILLAEKHLRSKEKQQNRQEEILHLQSAIYFAPLLRQSWSNAAALMLSLRCRKLASYFVNKALGIAEHGYDVYTFAKITDQQEDWLYYWDKYKSQSDNIDYGYALTAYYAGKPEIALPLFEQVIADNTHNEKNASDIQSTHMALAWHYLPRRMHNPGWFHYYHGCLRAKVSTPAWQGEALSGKHILVYADQGMGDNVQFIRLLAQLDAKQITFLCGPNILRLMSHVKPCENIRIQCFVGRTEDIDSYQADYQASIMDLCYLLNIDMEQDPAPPPYINPPEDKIQYWTTWLSNAAPNKFNIGITWAGNPDYANDHNRSTQLRDWLPLEPLLNKIALCSLQKNEASNQAYFHPQLQLQSHNIAIECDDLLDTAAAISALDLVIAIDTGLAHLAGALNKPVWVLIPAEGVDWRWGLQGDTVAWYPSMRLFRQQKGESWSAVLQRVADELALLLAKEGNK